MFDMPNMQVVHDSITTTRYLDQMTILFEDTETKGLDPRMDSPLLLVQLGNNEHQIVIDVASGVSLEPYRKYLEDPDLPKVCYNAVFEINMLRAHDINIQGIQDLMLKAKLIERGLSEEGKRISYSLAAVLQRYLNVYLDKTQQKTFIGNTGKYTLQQIQYAADDVKLDDLYTILQNKLEDNDLVDADIEENRFAYVVADMCWNGIYLNTDKWNVLEKTNRNQHKKDELALDQWLLDNVYYFVQGRIAHQLSLFDTEVRKLNINYNSPLQMKSILTEVLGFPPRDKKDKVTTDIKTLAKYKDDSPFIKLYIQFKKLGKLINTYGIEYLNNIQSTTGRVHFSVDQVLATGRISTFKPNLQQIPATELFRDCFTAQHEDYIMIGADYSGMESQVMADKSEDSSFIEFFKSGEADSHSMVASKVYSTKLKREVKVTGKSLSIKAKRGEDILAAEQFYELAGKFEDINMFSKKRVTDKGRNVTDNYFIFTYPPNVKCPLRQIGKTLNFMISFGGSAYSLHKQMEIPLKDAEDQINSFWKAFPELKQYFDKEKDFALTNGYSMIDPINRGKRFYPEHEDYIYLRDELNTIRTDLIAELGARDGLRQFYSMCRKGASYYMLNRDHMIKKGDIERQAMNTGIQGHAASITKRAAINFRKWLIQEGYGTTDKVKLVNIVHDEMLFEVKKDLAELMAKKLQYFMEEASVEFMTHLKIPAEPYIYTSWKK